MTSQQRRALVLTLAVLGGAFLFLHAVSEILLPFIVGLILAYIINPIVNHLEEMGLPRSAASVLLVGTAVGLMGAGLAFGVPLLLDQLTSFAQRLPVYLMTLQHFVLPEKFSKSIALSMNINALLKPLGAFGAQGADWTVRALQRTVSGVAWLANIAMLVLMTPVVAFYLLMDWPKLVSKTFKQFPKRWQKTMTTAAGEIDVKLSAYLRGMAAVCVSMAVFYAATLSSIGLVSSWLVRDQVPGLELGWAIGLLTGLMTFLPIIGASAGLILMLSVALMQYQLLLWEPYAMIAGIFFIGQFLEGYVLNPLLVGTRVGLHPLWVIFAILAGGTLGGLTGMLLAMPVAVVVSVVLPHVMKAWREAID